MKTFLFPIFIIFFCRINAQDSTDFFNNYYDSVLKHRLSIQGTQLKTFLIKARNGKQYSNKNLQNKITFINLWFEHCPPCIAEMDGLNNLYNKFRRHKNFQFLSFTFEKQKDVDRLITKFNIPHQVISITQPDCYVLNYKQGFPTRLVVNGKGKILYFDGGGPIDHKKASEGIVQNIYPIIAEALKKMNQSSHKQRTRHTIGP